MLYKLQKVEVNTKYYINTNKTVLYTYNVDKNHITMTYSSDFAASKMLVIEVKKDEEVKKSETIENILKSDNDFITTVIVIASTTKNTGFFTETNEDTGITTNYLNVYLNSVTFKEAKNNNKFNLKNNTIFELIEKECPSINYLINNIFYYEKDIVKLNFLNWLNVIGFKDTKQDVLFLFQGKSIEKDGQGAGKGVLRDLLSKMFSGLICSVSNESYCDKFNSELLNKKVVFFDEVDFKRLKYEKLKDVTGNSKLRIESKGKDAIVVDNVSSWLLFKNPPELYGKINSNDRRTFIINSNSEINNSLIELVIKPFYGGDYKSYENKLFSEVNNFIHILSLLPGKVKTPLELQTQGHYDYFNVKKTLVDIQDIKDIFNTNSKKTIFLEFLNELQLLGDIQKGSYINLKYFLERDFYYQNVFEKIFEICQEHKIANIKFNDSCRNIVKNIKDYLCDNGYEIYEIDTKLNINGSVKKLQKKGCVRLKTYTKEDQKNINQKLKMMILENMETQRQE